MTHAQLVKLAERWVRTHNTRYPVVLSDVHMTIVSEQPDVIAFGSSGSVLVECKASLEDFKRDAHKSFRRDPARGMGQRRYYCAPVGLLAKTVLPEGWGLLEPKPRGGLAIVVKASRVLPFNADAERTLLFGACQRAMEGWGRRMFGDAAPATMIDGDAHPSATRIIREQRAQIKRLEQELGALRRAESEAETKVETYG